MLVRCLPHGNRAAYIFLLLVNVTNLKPYVLFCQWPRRVYDNVFEALRGLEAGVMKSKGIVSPLNFERIFVAACK